MEVPCGRHGRTIQVGGLVEAAVITRETDLVMRVRALLRWHLNCTITCIRLHVTVQCVRGDGHAMMPEQLLKTNGFVSGLTEPQLKKLASLAQEKSFDEDDRILITGERSKNFYLLLSGSACVEAGSSFCTVCVQNLGPGDAFGWSSLLSSHDTLFQVRARERCTALFLGGEAVMALCQEDPELGVTLLRRVLEIVSQRVCGLELRLVEFWGFSKERSDRPVSKPLPLDGGCSSGPPGTPIRTAREHFLIEE